MKFAATQQFVIAPKVILGGTDQSKIDVNLTVLRQFLGSITFSVHGVCGLKPPMPIVNLTLFFLLKSY